LQLDPVKGGFSVSQSPIEQSYDSRSAAPANPALVKAIQADQGYKNSLPDAAHTRADTTDFVDHTVVYSLKSGDINESMEKATFDPQEVYGARRVILSDAGHNSFMEKYNDIRVSPTTGAAERVERKSGFQVDSDRGHDRVAYTQVRGKLPSGVYHATDRGRLEALGTGSVSNSQDLLKKIGDAPISGDRKDIIKDAVAGFGNPEFKSDYAQKQVGRGTMSRFFNAVFHPIKFVKSLLTGKTSQEKENTITEGFTAAQRKTQESTAAAREAQAALAAQAALEAQAAQAAAPEAQAPQTAQTQIGFAGLTTIVKEGSSNIADNITPFNETKAPESKMIEKFGKGRMI
jgi:hypothetical protein